MADNVTIEWNDGSQFSIPSSSLPEALQKGYRVVQQPPGALTRALQGGGLPGSKADIQGLISHVDNQNFNPFADLRDIGRAISSRVQQGTQQMMHGPDFLSKILGAGQAAYAGTPLAGVGDNVASGNLAGAGGQLISTLLGARAMAGKVPPKPAPDLAEILTNKVNPPAKQMAGFQKSLQAQLPNVLEHAENLDVPAKALKTPSTLADVLKSASDAKRTVYYQKMLGPVKDATVPITDIKGYQGGTTTTYRKPMINEIGKPDVPQGLLKGEPLSPSASVPVTGQSATLAQLDSRLSQINATLSPKYAKGGMAAQAAVTAEQSAALSQEAAAIRSKLYSSIGKLQGIDPADVASTRASFGAMSDLSEKIQAANSVQRRAVNIERQQLPWKLVKYGAGTVGLGAVGKIISDAISRR